LQKKAGTSANINGDMILSWKEEVRHKGDAAHCFVDCGLN